MSCVHCLGNGSWPNATDQDRWKILEEMNVAFFSSLQPTVVFLLGLAVCGLAGNSLVFVVYLHRLKSYPTRTYILAMCVCDLLTNCFSLPMEVMEIRLRFTYPADWLCRLGFTVVCFLVLFSGCLLVAVAVDRERTMCGQTRTSGLQRERRERWFVTACLVGSLLISLPMLGLLERKEVVLEDTGLTTLQCVYVQDSLFLTVLNRIHNGLFLCAFAVLCFAYGRIARHLWQHKKRANTTGVTCSDSSTKRDGTCVEINVTEASQSVQCLHGDPAQEVTHDDAPSPLPQVCPPSTDSETTDTLTPPSTEPGTEGGEMSSARSQTALSLCFVKRRSDVTRHPQRKERNRKASKGGSRRTRTLTNRTTLMLFILTVIFFINYLPYLLTVVLRTVGSEEQLVRHLGLNLYFILLRTIYMNSAVNPFVYTFHLPRFRKECRHVLGCTC
ncbi:uncharacterized protein LOC143297389 [Babylonia areolata]|uniref:uncharacterized protein LOC143297389 n=1 Tax=Babylonia areolata TaxID=304850 RepID=UPI003FD1D534